MRRLKPARARSARKRAKLVVSVWTATKGVTVCETARASVRLLPFSHTSAVSSPAPHVVLSAPVVRADKVVWLTVVTPRPIASVVVPALLRPCGARLKRLTVRREVSPVKVAADVAVLRVVFGRRSPTLRERVALSALAMAPPLTAVVTRKTRLIVAA